MPTHKLANFKFQPRCLSSTLSGSNSCSAFSTPTALRFSGKHCRPLRGTAVVRMGVECGRKLRQKDIVRSVHRFALSRFCPNVSKAELCEILFFNTSENLPSLEKSLKKCGRFLPVKTCRVATRTHIAAYVNQKRNWNSPPCELSSCAFSATLDRVCAFCVPFDL